MAKNFAVMPSVSISRSKFKRTSQHKTTFNLGDIIPIYVDEVLPGDTRNISLASLVRMSTPVFPIMDNIHIDFYAFFVPNRLTWEHWKEFMGENTSSAGAVLPTNYSVPDITIHGSNALSTGSLGDYMGLPVGVAGTSTTIFGVSCLPIRGYRLIYNRWFRDQNIQAPLVVNKGDTANQTYDSYNQVPLKACKDSDYFTRALPYAQKGNPVTIPLGSTAELAVDSSLHPLGGNLRFGHEGAVLANAALGIGATLGQVAANGSFSQGTLANTSVNQTNLVADLSTATATTINQLRFAFQYQKLLEKDALYGTRYWEILHAHFGVNAPDASLQDPEFLGSSRMNINIDQVLQTSQTDTVTQDYLGQPGANSVTGFKGNLFTKSFTEHGYVFILAVARHDQTYGQGINRMWSRRMRTDFYFPVFANLGAQEIKKKELYAQGTNVDDEVFGYQEAWAEYRYKPSLVTASLKPNISATLGGWTLANNFTSMPTLGDTFIKQDRDALGRALVTGASGPDFIADFLFQDIAVRPMPLYSVPGLIDHH